MQDRVLFKTLEFPVPVVAPLKTMSEEEFAALGAGTVVFLRPVTAAQLVPFIPQAQTMPPEMEFNLIMSADGAPILVTDNSEAVSDWLDENEVTLVQRH
jgi:hypothetical protein